MALQLEETAQAPMDGAGSALPPVRERSRSPALKDDQLIPSGTGPEGVLALSHETNRSTSGVTGANPVPRSGFPESSAVSTEDETITGPSKLDPPEPTLARGLLRSRTAEPPQSKSARQAQGLEGHISQTDGPFDTLRPRRHPAPAEDASTLARRSVQFARRESETRSGDHLSGPQNMPYSTAAEDSPGRERKGFAFFSKLKALTAPSGLPGHGRSQSGFTIGEDSMDDGTPFEPFTPEFERGTPRSPGILEEEREEEENGAEADHEGSSGEGRVASPSHHRKKRGRRESSGGTQTAPTTPKTPGHVNGHGDRLLPPEGAVTDDEQPQVLRRRATMTDVPEDRRARVSEDEGHDRLAKDAASKRPTFWNRGAIPATEEGRRPVNLRRLTGFAIGSENTAASSPGSRWRVSEWNASAGSARWKALKAGFKLMGPRRKDEHKVDQIKSAELLAELTAGTPAALIIASMFQRDDHGHKRIPVLLEQLKVKLTDSKKADHKPSSDRHQIFRIELEYGSGLTRMKWVIYRSLRDFSNLHIRYKLQTSSEKYKHINDPSRPKIPRFPRTAFPFLRGVRGLGSEDEDDGDDIAEEEAGASANEGTATSAERHVKKRRKRPQLSRNRRGSAPGRSDSVDVTSDSPNTIGYLTATGSGLQSHRKESYSERQRKKLEQYLQQLIRHLMFHADSTRLCKFLELSSLGIRLAAEGSYHGKEGFLVIQSAKGFDFRKAWHPSLFARRHAPKWFLVRHSYIVCVDSPEEMNIYDVFLVDPDFEVKCKNGQLRDQKPKPITATAKKSAARPQHHSLKIRNSERKLRLLAKNERQLSQFEHSIKIMMRDTIWSKPHRFDSFAPVRTKVFAQWLVDGRDYMWNVSRAISMARDVVYIHDWWLSPELYMRRPPAISRKWRLDRLLQRKAADGVKIFVILYRNINSAVPIDSSYTKFSLLDLHPNVFVQRSPNQFRQNTFFWAHHEKICIVDHIVAFVGGLDLCFGRWDTPQHTLCDDKLTGFEQSDVPKDADHCQLWPGKDYSNPRVQDFYALDKPYEEMYDRTIVPRMPWHDISMQIVGQPARDLTRHFVQRWNYILRQRKPTRPTPFLLPPPDFNPADLEALGLDGTCEVQILRSSSWWSIGTSDKTEHSIMNAYVKMIEQSEHFVYIENQFFISSCEVEGTVVENLIGDALVERAVRAFKNGDDWRAVIVIPLVPGFQNTVDSQDGTSVRLIMQCQYRSICRGESSIFGRLRAQHIEPEDYIQFFSLRSWGKIGPSKMLVTEQLYIHAKCMIVDDRIAIIGSANINERSMLGSRDSECAAIVRDTDMLESSMNGKPYVVGRFPHTLRMRLMREHLGVDVDEFREESELESVRQHGTEGGGEGGGEGETSHNGDAAGSSQETGDPKETLMRAMGYHGSSPEDVIARSENMFSFNHDVDWEQANNPNLRSDKRLTEDKRVTGNLEHKKDVEGKGPDHMLDEPNPIIDHGRDSALVGGAREVLIVDVDSEGRGTLTAPRRSSSPELRAGTPLSDKAEDATPYPTLAAAHPSQPTDAEPPRSSHSGIRFGDKNADNEGASILNKPARLVSELVSSIVADMSRPTVDENCMKDPLSDTFFHDIWHAVAENNTKLFRYVFRCMPDNEVKGWKEYKEYLAYAERFSQAQGADKSKARMQQEAPGRSGPPGFGSQIEKLVALPALGDGTGSTEKKVDKVFHKNPAKRQGMLSMDNVAEWAENANRAQAERQEAEKATRTPESKPGDEVVDEKAALKSDLADARSHVTTTEEANAEKPAGRSSPPLSSAAETFRKNSTSQRRRRRTMTRSSRKEFLASDDLMERADAEELLSRVQGHLVLWPYDWLEREEQGGNWLYSIDQLAPLEIYN